MSRDQGSFLPITCQGSILTLRHVGWFGITIQKYVDLIVIQLQLLGHFQKYFEIRV